MKTIWDKLPIHDRQAILKRMGMSRSGYEYKPYSQLPPGMKRANL